MFLSFPFSTLSQKTLSHGLPFLNRVSGPKIVAPHKPYLLHATTPSPSLILHQPQFLPLTRSLPGPTPLPKHLSPKALLPLLNAPLPSHHSHHHPEHYDDYDVRYLRTFKVLLVLDLLWLAPTYLDTSLADCQLKLYWHVYSLLTREFIKTRVTCCRCRHLPRGWRLFWRCSTLNIFVHLNQIFLCSRCRPTTNSPTTWLTPILATFTITQRPSLSTRLRDSTRSNFLMVEPRSDEIRGKVLKVAISWAKDIWSCLTKQESWLMRKVDWWGKLIDEESWLIRKI